MNTRSRRRLRVALLVLGCSGAVWATLHLTFIQPARLRRKAEAAATRTKAKAEKKAGRPAQSLVARSGLPHLRAKLDARNPVTVAFLGGSITQNGGADGFVSMLPAWLESRAPGVKVHAINAGLAATGSDFGAKRIDRDVLVHRPDLVVVEFAVNDGSRECTADMERLVRKVRLADAQTDMLFLYTIMDWSLPKLERGSFPKSVRQHEQVAAHYDIPTIALGYEAARKIRAGEWTWANFSPDACHPTPNGYASYNHDLAAVLPALIAVAGPRPAALPPSLTPGLVEYPPPVHAEPQPPPLAMGDDAGRAALETWELPVIGAQWIGEPVYSRGPEVRWSLFFRPLAEPSAGGDRALWKPARWFEEERSFTGNTAHPVAQWQAGGNRIGANPTDGAVLTWRAAEAGAYTIRISAGGAEGSGSGSAEWSILRFTTSNGLGEKLGAMKVTPGEAGAAWEQRVALGAGGEVALAMLVQQMEYVVARDFRVTIGRFAP